MIPHERSLVDKLQGKPFALLGINTDGDLNSFKQQCMDQGVTWQAQAELPPKLLEGVKQPLMHKATIRQQGDELTSRQECMHLLEHRLVGFKADPGASVAHSSPGERNCPTTIDEGGADHYKGREGSGIQGDIETLISRPVNEGRLQYRPIPL